MSDVKKVPVGSVLVVVWGTMQFALPSIAVGQTSQQSYVLVDLGTLGGDESGASGLNDRGVVVGWSLDAEGRLKSFLWRDGIMQKILPEYSGVFPMDVNNSDQVVGGGTGPAFIWEDGNVIEIYDAPSRGTAVNETVQVAGLADDPQGRHFAFLWEEGNIQNLGTLGGEHSAAWDINDLGQVVGQADNRKDRFRAFIWEDGRMMDLGTLPRGGHSSRAYGINNRTQIVGMSYGRQSTRAFVWEDGLMRGLRSLEGHLSVAQRINDNGQIVGYSGLRGGKRHAVLWEDDVIFDLNDVVVNKCGKTEIVDAKDINESGQIVALGEIDGLDRAYLLTPGPLACDDIDEFDVSCNERMRLKAKVKTRLIGGTILPFTENGSDCRQIIVNKRGNGKVVWRDRGGLHEVCLVSCPHLCLEVECP